MRIKINDDELQFSGSTLRDLFNEFDFKENTGIAIAVNDTVIPRNEWNSYKVNEGDSVLIITPAQGG